MLVIVLFVLGLAISSAIAWTTFRDPHDISHSSFSESVALPIIFSSTCVAMGSLFFIQRIRLDADKSSVSFANVTTLHTWRTLQASEIKLIEFDSAHGKLNSMIDTLRLSVNCKNEARELQSMLLDCKLSSFNKNKPSQLFRGIINFIRQHNPHVLVMPRSLEK